MEILKNKPKLNNWLLMLMIGLSAAAYFLLAYHILRTEINWLWGDFAVLFGLYALIINSNLNSKQLKIAVYAAIIFRLMFLPALPQLSDDYYRFIWDGRLFANGFNPFNFLPSAIIHTGVAVKSGLSEHLYSLLNSPHYYTVYPPIMQYTFGLAAKVFPHNEQACTLIIRLPIIAAEIGSIILIKKLLKHWQKEEKLILIYAWNPLIIAELTGNLHFEAVMIFFILSAVYLWAKQRKTLAIIAYGLAVATKLLPLIFLPLLIRRIGWRKTIITGISAGIITLLLFVPFLNITFLRHIFSSLDLYFQTFEFNASVFYLLRWLGFVAIGSDIIPVAGIVLMLCTIYGIFRYAQKEKAPNVKNIFQAMMWVLMIYLLFASIVHPWYITPLIAFSVFTRYRFTIVWSATILLTYSAYTHFPYHEHLGLVALEYAVVLGVFLKEYFINTQNYAEHP